MANLMIIGGSLYLLMLAKNYTTSQKRELQLFFEMLMNIELCILLFINNRNIDKQIKKLQQTIDHEEVPDAILPALTLKKRQLRSLKWIIVAFYVPNIYYSIESIILSMVGEYNEYHQIVKVVVLELIRLVSISSLLWIFKPRSSWPAFYGLGIDELHDSSKLQMEQKRI